MPGSTDSDITGADERSAGVEGTSDSARVEYSALQIWLATNRSTLIRISLLAFVVGFVLVGIILWTTDSLTLENAGYGGVWIISFIAAGSIFLPVPGPAAVCVAAVPDFGLNPLAIGIISASAEALGEMTGYIAGLSGRSLLQKHRFYPRVHGLVRRHGGLILFFGSIIPNPLFDVIGIAAGSVAYPIKKFLVVVFFAKAIKSTSIAYACFLGIDWIQGYFG